MNAYDVRIKIPFNSPHEMNSLLIHFNYSEVFKLICVVFSDMKMQSQGGSYIAGAPSLLSMDISMPDFLQGQHWDEGNEPSMQEAKMRFNTRTGRPEVEDDGIDPNAGPIGPSGPMMGHFGGRFPPPGDEHFNHQGGPMPRPPFDGHFPGPRGPRPRHDFYGPPPPRMHFEGEMHHHGGLPEGSGYQDENWGDQPLPQFQGQFPAPGGFPHGPPRFDGPPPPHMRGPPPNFHGPPPPHEGAPPPWHEGGAWEGEQQHM